MTEKTTATLVGGQIIAPANDITRELYDKNRFGEKSGKSNFIYSFVEGFLLVEKGKLEIVEKRKPLTFEQFIKKVKKTEPTFWVRYSVYKDLRKRGYIVKTALKFGADFRVYDRGVKPGEDHAKWTVLSVDEASKISWYEYAAQNRVAHSTRKRLLLAIVDAEGAVTYYENKWTRP